MTSKARIILVLLCAALFISGFWLFSKRPDDTTPGPYSVTLAHDKGNLPIFQENFIKQGELSEKSIGIGINPIPSETPDLYRHQMMASLATDQAPDLFIWWSTFRAEELVKHDYVVDMTDIWDKYAGDYSPEMREVFTLSGKVYGFPYVVEYWPVWYNKSLFRRLGLAVPQTWDEFIVICEKLKDSGVPPILSSLQNDWPAFIWFEEMIVGEDPGLYKDLCLGRISYTDPRVVKAVTVWKTMIEKGYFTDPSVNMLTNSGYLWNNEKFGMVLCGTWYYSAVLVAQGVDEESIGTFILPSHNLRAGKNIIFEVGPMFVSKHGPNLTDALKVADWWMSPEGNVAFAKRHKAYPGSLQADTGYLPPIKQSLIRDIIGGHYRLMNRYWEATPPAICETAVLKLGEFILNPDSMHDILKDIDRVADSYWKGHTQQ